jgi:[FeFe] hydrogenase H-cluster maturation GTPase HydF
MNNLQETPRANRLHIGIFGRRNSGKSSLINAVTNQQVALVSDTPGTTTDPVYKSMEMYPVGPVVIIDTAGFDDEGELGKLRVEKTEEVVDRTDVAVVVIDATRIPDYKPSESTLAVLESQLSYEKIWIKSLDKKDVPIIVVVNKCDLIEDEEGLECIKENVRWTLGQNNIIEASMGEHRGVDEIRIAIGKAAPEDLHREKILAGLIEEGDTVLLVMPQDIQAPKGRLILPQVQTLRELLDRKCTAIATTADGYARALERLKDAPDLIITDSQCFNMVYENKPEGSKLTSFSVLYAAYKGDIDSFVEGAKKLDELNENSKVLIAEACTHVPLNEDIGRVKIPRLLRKKFGEGLTVTNVCGADFPHVDILKEYDLVIHCGACMFNRKHVMNRIAEAQYAGIPITNYGITIAKLGGILDKISLP